jgi:hypothetical protein
VTPVEPGVPIVVALEGELNVLLPVPGMVVPLVVVVVEPGSVLVPVAGIVVPGRSVPVDVPVVVVVLVVVVVRVPEPETAPVVVEAAPELVELAEVVVVPPLAP